MAAIDQLTGLPVLAAAAVCSLVSTILTDDGLHAAYVLQEEATADYSPAELADDRWQEHGVRLLHVGEGPARRTYILIDDQDVFAGFVEQEAESAEANGMTEPALSLLRDMLWEYAPRLSILPSDGSRDPLIRGRLDAVQRTTSVAGRHRGNGEQDGAAGIPRPRVPRRRGTVRARQRQRPWQALEVDGPGNGQVRHVRAEFVGRPLMKRPTSDRLAGGVRAGGQPGCRLRHARRNSPPP